MNDIFIWWVDRWDLMMVSSISEQAECGHPDYTPLPGHLNMVLRDVRRIPTWTGVKIVTPVTLDHGETLSRAHSDLSRIALLKRHVGIAFEAIHHGTVSKYPGIITDLNFELVE